MDKNFFAVKSEASGPASIVEDRENLERGEKLKERLKAIIQAVSGRKNLEITTEVDAASRLQLIRDGHDPDQTWFHSRQHSRTTKELSKEYIHIPPKILESSENVAKGKAAHEAGHAAITRLGEFIPDDVMRELGFGSIISAVEELPTDEVVRQRYEGAGDWVDEARADSIADAKKPASFDGISKRPRFAQLCDLLVYGRHFDKIPAGYDKEVVELYEKNREVLRDIERMLPEEGSSEERVIEKAKERYRAVYGKIWKDAKKMIEKDKSDQGGTEVLKKMAEEEGGIGEKIKQELDKLPEDLKKEIEKVIEEIQKKLAEKKEEKKKEELEEDSQRGDPGTSGGESSSEKEEKEGDLSEDQDGDPGTSGGESSGEIDEESSESEDGQEGSEEKGDASPSKKKGEKKSKKGDSTDRGSEMDDEGQDKGSEKPIEISDDLKKALKDIIEKLPKEIRDKIKKQAEKELEKIEDDMIDKLKGGLDEKPIEKHSEREERERVEYERKEWEKEMKAIEKKIARATESTTDYDDVYKEMHQLDRILYEELEDIFIPNLKSKDSLRSSGAKINLPAVFKREADISSGSANPNARIFEIKKHPEKKDYVVTILIDLSGSMEGENITEAFKGVVLLTEVISRLGVRLEILGFHNDDMLSFKNFDEKLNDEVRKKISTMVDEAEGDNDDGPSLEKASARLAEQSGKEKIIMVISDGKPSRYSNSSSKLENAIERISKETDHKLIGIGLGSDATHVGNYYPIALPGIKTKELASTLGGLLKDIFENPQKYAK